jgi:hypothetical protein
VCGFLKVLILLLFLFENFWRAKCLSKPYFCSENAGKYTDG